jgi:hypothetical protein
MKRLVSIAVLALLVLILSVGMVSATVQTFQTDTGDVEIDLPYIVEPGQISGGDSLSLVKPGTTKPIISINLWNATEYGMIYKDFKEFAESFIGPGYAFEEMTSNDGKPMLFNALQEGTDLDGNPKYTFRGYINDSVENDRYIVIHAPNNVVYQGEIIATYTKDEFVAICKSFVIK